MWLFRIFNFFVYSCVSLKLRNLKLHKYGCVCVCVCVLQNTFVALSKPFAETSPFPPYNTDPVKGSNLTRRCLLVPLFGWFAHTKSAVLSTTGCKFAQTFVRSAHDSRVDPYMGQQELWEGQKILALLELIASNEYPELVKMIASPNILADALPQIRGKRWLAGQGDCCLSNRYQRHRLSYPVSVSLMALCVRKFLQWNLQHCFVLCGLYLSLVRAVLSPGALCCHLCGRREPTPRRAISVFLAHAFRILTAALYFMVFRNHIR